MRFLFALVIAPFLLAAKQPVELQPLAPWNLHYGDNSCQLIRTFGEAAKPTTLVLEPVTPRSNLTMMTFGGQLKARQGREEATATFLPFTDNRFERGNVAETAGTKETAILWSRVNFLAGPKPPEKKSKPGLQTARNLAEEAAEREEEAQSAAKIVAVEIREPGGRKVVLKSGPLGRAAVMMRQCANEQLGQWGVDPAVEHKIVKGAVRAMNVANLFDSSDYPSSAFMAGEQSVIQGRLNIGADGLVSRCTSLTRFRAPDFATVTCSKLKRLRYKPAELADGTKVPSYDLVEVRFVMP